MKRWYSVDDNRVCVVGDSMGGRGTWAIASLHPDLFAAAAPAYGWANGLPLENLLNVPILNQHGDADWTVSVDQSRFAIDRLRNMSSPVLYKDHPGAGHRLKRPLNTTSWVLSHTRNNSPQQIRYTCESTDRGKAYWTNVCRMKDPHRSAHVGAIVNKVENIQSITFGLENIGVLGVDLTGAPINTKMDVLLQANRVRVEARLQKRIADADYVLFRNDSGLIYCDTSSFTLADQRVFAGEEKDLIVGDLRGEALAKIRLNEKNTIVGVYPERSEKKVTPNRICRVAVPPTLTWELNKHEVSLKNVKALRYHSHESWVDLFQE